ncbi:MAG: adenosylcobinamide-GDP ribazoletransferase [Psychromonas sp.]|uniref:adenosylcobinamide-GDP ribazoletransferase n=1 Tax=Psychromonas sp. TaxID=1884585 RepID=UPI0039E71508
MSCKKREFHAYKEIIKKEFNLLFLALSFFSRIPTPKKMIYSPRLLNQSNRYFSLVGLLLALLQGAFFLIFIQILPAPITLILMLAAGLILTGAFHEDGLADMADGIGGGLNIEQRLSIMKDSRVGTYGVVTLVTILALKYLLLLELAQKGYLYTDSHLFFLVCLTLGFSLSRAVAASLIINTAYVREKKSSKSTTLASAQKPQELFILLAVALLPAWYFSFYEVLSLILLLFIFRQLFRAWLIDKIGGITGDCLGAAQQISEVIIYIVLMASLTLNPS